VERGGIVGVKGLQPGRERIRKRGPHAVAGDMHETQTAEGKELSDVLYFHEGQDGQKELGPEREGRRPEE